MRLRLGDSKAIVLRVFVATGFIAAFLFTLILSASPQLHERIHPLSAAASHECAVTLLTSGNCSHTPFETITAAPPPSQHASALSCRYFQLVSLRLDFSLLEHAPPAIS